MRALNRVFRAKTINTQRRGVAFSIRQLFANSEPGVWYDPSDMSTLFQDSAGTTPVTAVEQPVGLMLDKSKGLVLGPELVTNGTFNTNIDGWSSVNNAVLSWQSEKLQISGNGTTSFPYAVQTISGLTVGKSYKFYGTANKVSGADNQALIQIGAALSGTNRVTNGEMSAVWLATATSVQVRLMLVNATSTYNFDNISVRELPGNHASQTTTTSRPVLSARVNLLTKTEQFDDAVWTKNNLLTFGSGSNVNAAVAPDGTTTADLITPATGTAFTGVDQYYNNTVSAAHTLSVYVKANGANFVQLLWNAGLSSNFANFDLSTGAVTAGVYTNATITAQGNGWFRCTITSTLAISFQRAYISVIPTANSSRAAAYTGDGTSGIYIWGADLRVANDGANLPPYQRVNTATDYDTAGFPHYLRFDGVDDWLVTPTITPGTDKAQVFAGVRKLSDAAIGTVLGLGAVNSGGFEVFESDSGAGAGSNNTSFNVYMANSSFFNGDVAPFSRVAAIEIDRSLPRATETKVRSNGNSKTLFVLGTDATGNFLAYPLYIGRRGGTTIPFNGHIYGLIVRFGANLPIETIEKTEKYINQKTRAY